MLTTRVSALRLLKGKWHNAIFFEIMCLQSVAEKYFCQIDNYFALHQRKQRQLFYLNALIGILWGIFFNVNR